MDSAVKKALVEIRELKAKLRATRAPIAIVGSGLRFPGGVDDLESLWRLLEGGVDAVREVPAERWDLDRWYDEDPDTPGKMNIRHGGFLDAIDRFDPEFFGISPREAESMDPQQRLLLEVAWEALEDAAIPPQRLFGGSTGIFVGIGNGDYYRRLFADPHRIGAYSATGALFSVAAGRLSYVLGATGPAVAVDTACSSSLVGIHMAMQSLRRGECELALAGGVNLMLSPEIHLNFSINRMLAVDGRCKTFDAKANGYVRGDGCAIVALKRLDRALADGDRIHAVLRGSAINQDGRSQGLTAPSGPSQEAVLRAALADARLAPDAVDYVEAHGTGTSLGDPIEVGALGAVYGSEREATSLLQIGSIKTNVGHLESAAGIAGLLKSVVAMRHETIPPHLHLTEKNPLIPWDRWPIDVPTEPTPWKRGERARVAGISSFGFSGTNAHLIVEEPPLREGEAASELEAPTASTMTLSARTPEALAAMIEDRIAALEGAMRFEDLCYTANVGRDAHEERLAVTAADAGEMVAALREIEADDHPENIARGRCPAGFEATPVAMLFTGQGAQRVGMAAQLYRSEPTVRRVLDRCDEVLRPQIGRSLNEILFDGPEDVLHEMRIAQPATFAVEVALAEMWRAWGVEPSIVIGHSLGEIAAAYLADVFDLEAALLLVAERGRLLHELPGDGAMASLLASSDRVQALIADESERLSIAAINGPESTVISGAAAALEAVEPRFAAEGIKFKRLAVRQAAHSPYVEPMREPFAEALAKIEFREPNVDLLSNLFGRVAEPGEVANADYWARHLREPVRFGEGIAAAVDAGCRLFLEVGPAATLTSMAQSCTSEDCRWLTTLKPEVDEWQCVGEAAGGLFVGGAAIDFRRFHAERGLAKVRLPTYPFQRQRLWFDLGVSQSAARKGRWESAVEAGSTQSGQVPIDLDLPSYPEKWRSLDELSRASTLGALHELKLLCNAGESLSVDEALAQAGIESTYRHLIARWFGRLADEGILDRDGERFVASRALPASGLEAARETATAAFGEGSPIVRYLVGCAEKAARVLTGEESPLETLFPGGSYALTDFLYHEWPMARYFNAIVRQAVRSAAATSRELHTLRVLEIGAGTGGTARETIPALVGENAQYTFTDVSDFFLDRARDLFAELPFVHYAQLDVSKDPRAQGFEPGSFDVIVASNVLHATPHLDHTAANVLSLLAPGGFVAAYETTEHPYWFDVSTALIEGWQSFDDSYRDDHPLVDASRWCEIFTKNGFVEARAWPEPDSPATVLRQAVVIARAPGEEQSAQGSIAETDDEIVEAEAQESKACFSQELAEALPDERLDLMIAFTRRTVARVLRKRDPEAIDISRRLLDLGLDSLMAVDLRNRLSQGLEVERDAISATLIFDYPNIRALAEHLLEEHAAEAGEAESVAPSASTGKSDDVDEQQLLEKLEKMSTGRRGRRNRR